MATTPSNTGKRLPLAKWEKIKERYIAGETAVSIAKLFRISANAIHERAKAGGWKEARKQTEERLKAAPPAASLDLPRTIDSLTNAETPEEFQNTLSRIAKTLMAVGLQSLQPPRSIAEAKALNDMIRKADGLESRSSEQAPIPLFSPLPTLPRKV